MVVTHGAILLRRVTVSAAFLAMAGCSLNWPQPDSGQETIATAPEPAPAPLETVPPPMPDRPVEPEPEIDKPLPPVAIVVTGSHPAYADVAAALGKLLENYTIHNLEDRSQPPVVVLGRINDSESAAVVAIGLRAAQSSVAMAEMPVVFSQVFNVADHGLVTDNSRGVAALPPLEPQLAAWKELEPTLSRVGVIIGKNQDALLLEAEAAAERHDVELIVHESGSDQETLYLFRRMIHDIDGFWLFPDNRILSPRALTEILDEARTRSVQVAAFNEAMLAMGATLTASTLAADVAQTIVDVLKKIRAQQIDSLPPLSPLSEIRIVSRGEAADARASRQP